MEAFLFAVKGKPEDYSDAFIAMTPKGEEFMMHGLRKNELDVAKDFEAFVISIMHGM